VFVPAKLAQCAIYRFSLEKKPKIHAQGVEIESVSEKSEAMVDDSKTGD
jgi:hypothetical protein